MRQVITGRWSCSWSHLVILCPLPSSCQVARYHREGVLVINSPEPRKGRVGKLALGAGGWRRRTCRHCSRPGSPCWRLSVDTNRLYTNTSTNYNNANDLEEPGSTGKELPRPARLKAACSRPSWRNCGSLVVKNVKNNQSINPIINPLVILSINPLSHSIIPIVIRSINPLIHQTAI